MITRNFVFFAMLLSVVVFTFFPITTEANRTSDPTTCDFDPNDPAVGCWITRHRGYPSHYRWILNLKKDKSWFYDRLKNISQGKFRRGGIEYAYGLPNNPEFARFYPEPHFSLYDNVGLPTAWKRGYEIIWNAPEFYEDYSIMDLRPHRSETDYFILDGGKHYAMTLLRLNTTKITADMLTIDARYDDITDTYQIITPIGNTWYEVVTEKDIKVGKTAKDFGESTAEIFGLIYDNAIYHGKIKLRSRGLPADDIINVAETLVPLYLGGKSASFLGKLLFRVKHLLTPKGHKTLGEMYGWYKENKPPLILGKHKSLTKWKNRFKRGNWTAQQIRDTYNEGNTYTAKNHVNKGNTATRYYNKKLDKSIVVDDVNGEILQLGRKGFDY